MMRWEPKDAQDRKYEPQRTTGGLLVYIGIVAATPLAMAYPVVAAIGLIVAGVLIWKGRSGRHTISRRSSHELEP